MSKKKLKRCIFCRKNSADSKDHVFSRGLFPPSLPVNYDGYTVPACSKCNKSFSLDEELFRNLITSLGLEESFYARELWDTKIKKSVQRKPALAKTIFKRMELVDFYTPDGIYVGKKTKMTIDKEIKDRVDNVLTKYTKGLFYKHFESEIPSRHEIRVVWNDEMKNIPELLKKVKPIAKVGSILSYGYNHEKVKPIAKVGSILSYGYNHVEGTSNSVWFYLFYEKMPFIVFVVDETISGDNS